MIDENLQLDIDTGENPVEWVLETMQTNWPGPEVPSELSWIIRDESKDTEDGDRSRTDEIETSAPVSVAHADTAYDELSMAYHFHFEVIVSVRVEAMQGSETEYGTVTSGAAFRSIVEALKEALKRERKEPAIEGGVRNYRTILFENEQMQSGEHRDYFRAQWDLRMVGNEIRED